ncbi:hypothetical protein INT45_002494, partial [Circinella minor]
DSCSGKSTLAHYLKHQPNIKADNKNEYSDNEPSQQHKEACFIRTVASGGYVKAVKQDLDAETTKMLGVGYTSSLVHNQNNEAILRLGIYQLDNKQLFSLLDPVLTDDNLFGIIVLDWTKPWTFLESLQLWLSVLNRWSAKVVTNESKNKVEEYLREYKYQLNDNNTNNSDHDVVAAEVHGTFTVNLGIPIAVVCCKSDAQKMLEEEYGYDEAQLDYIQQTLRCICMKCNYGAALFYTSTFHPSTFNNLREYIAHRSDSTIPSTIQPQHAESTRVLIPAGWDTWEKIKALEENSQCKVEKEWNDIIQNQSGDEITTGHSIYCEAIPEPVYENQCQGSQSTVTSEDEQVLYARYFQHSSAVQPPLPPPLSTTFLRELEHCKASISISPPKDTLKYTSLPLLPTTHHIEMGTATTSTTATISPPAVSLYTTSTTATTSVNTISSSLSTTANSRNNNNPTSMTGFSTTTNVSSTYNNKIGVTASPSSEIISQFFQKLLYKNMEQTPSSTGDGDGDGAANDRISHSSGGVDSSMHNSRPPCVNTT